MQQYSSSQTEGVGIRKKTNIEMNALFDIDVVHSNVYDLENEWH